MEYTGPGRAIPEPEHVETVKIGFIGPIMSTVSVATGGKSHEEVLGIQMEWKGEGIEEKGYDAATGSGRYQHTVRNFLAVRAFGTDEGQNEAYLHDYNPETDTFVEDGDDARLYNHRFSISLEAFDDVHAEPAEAALLAADEPDVGVMAAQQVAGQASEGSKRDEEELQYLDAVFADLWSLEC